MRRSSDHAVSNYRSYTNIMSDPLFVDPAAGDLRLGDGSPCVDAASSAATEDFTGAKRPEG